MTRHLPLVLVFALLGVPPAAAYARPCTCSELIDDNGGCNPACSVLDPELSGCWVKAAAGVSADTLVFELYVPGSSGGGGRFECRDPSALKCGLEIFLANGNQPTAIDCNGDAASKPVCHQFHIETDPAQSGRLLVALTADDTDPSPGDGLSLLTLPPELTVCPLGDFVKVMAVPRYPPTKFAFGIELVKKGRRFISTDPTIATQGHQ